MQAPRAVEEHAGKTFSEVKSPRVDFAQRADQRSSRAAFACGKAIGFLKEGVVGERGERSSRRHVRSYRRLMTGGVTNTARITRHSAREEYGETCATRARHPWQYRRICATASSRCPRARDALIAGLRAQAQTDMVADVDLEKVSLLHMAEGPRAAPAIIAALAKPTPLE